MHREAWLWGLALVDVFPTLRTMVEVTRRTRPAPEAASGMQDLFPLSDLSAQPALDDGEAYEAVEASAEDEAGPYLGPISEIAEVLVDGSGRLGSLSYLVPEGMQVRLGDAVGVPFGVQRRYGVVLGLSPATAATRRASKATRPIADVYGTRVSPDDVAVIRALTDFHFSDMTSVSSRLSPRNGRGSEPYDAGPVRLSAGGDPLGSVSLDPSVTRRLYVRAPASDAARIAAAEAVRLHKERGGQVLVLAPTTALVKQITDQFVSGAARLDSGALPGAWKGFTTGTVIIGVGTRAAALYAAPRLVGIVVAEEDAYGHREPSQPAWHARDVAVARSRGLRTALTLISSAPSPEAMGAVDRGVALGGASSWPQLVVIDRGMSDPVSRAVPEVLRSLLSDAAEGGRTPVVVASAGSTVRRCASCGAPRSCTQCEAVVCRHPADGPCAECGSLRVRLSGWSVERVSTELAGAEAEVITPTDLETAAPSGCVVLFDIDSALHRPDLLGEYPAWRLMMAAARAAGAGGVLAIVTDAPDHPFFAAFAAQDSLTPARDAWETARAACLPPFGRLVRIRCGQDKSPRVSAWPGRVSGPARVGQEWEVLVRCKDEDLPRLRSAVDRLRRGGKVRVQVS